MASWLCAATTYGSTAGASARKRWKGVLDRFILSGRNVIMRRFWRSQVVFLTVLICWLRTAANGILPDLCGWYIFRKSLSHSTPKHRYKAGSFLTFEHSDASPGLIHRGWLGGFYQSALGLWEDTPMVCNLAWSHSIGFFHSFCRDSDVINKRQRGEWDDTVKDTVNSS